MRLNDEQMAQVEFNRGKATGIEEGESSRVEAEAIRTKTYHLNEWLLTPEEIKQAWDNAILEGITGRTLEEVADKARAAQRRAVAQAEAKKIVERLEPDLLMIVQIIRNSSEAPNVLETLARQVNQTLEKWKALRKEAGVD